MGDNLFNTIIVSTFLFFFLTFFIIYLTVFQNKKKLFFKQELLRSQIEIQEQTFNSISQEIHDNVGQILSLVKVQLNIIDESETTDKALLGDAKDNISKAMTDLRDIAKGLSSERIRIVGLSTAIEQEIQRINRTGIVHIRFEMKGTELKIDNQKQLILFRVIQESLQNIIKHAAASSVSILFAYQTVSLVITITDNGKGFNFQQEQLAYQGLGLQNIFKRMDMIGGKAEINSVLQEGTTLLLTIPYV
jgi:signal transduction histidine kinase